MGKPVAVILAAGEGKRMKSKTPKVLHSLCGRPIIEHVLFQVAPLTERQVVVVGHGAEQVKAVVGEGVEYVRQLEQKGTGHALLQVQPHLPPAGKVLVLCGDTPMLKREIMEGMLRAASGRAAVVLTAVVPDPKGYGRIIRCGEGGVSRIVEEKDAGDADKSIREINAGAYCFQAEVLAKYLPALSSDNAQREFYLPDLIALLVQDGKPVEAYCLEDYRPALGINDRYQLAEAAAIMRSEINSSHMRQGVTFVDPESTYIDIDVEIGGDSVIYPQTVIEGHSVIEEDCVIGPGVYLKDTYIGRGVTVQHSVIFESRVEAGATIGPFAHIRPASVIGPGAKIGNFVEVKKSTVGKGSKIPHHSYVGDAAIGAGVNMGAGTIIVNYDGKRKNQTHIGNGAFIGCNSNLVAPLHIGEGAYVAAGSTVTRDVPPFALSLGRAKQVNREGLARRFLKRSED